MSSRVYVVGYEHYYDDYKRGEASASIIAVYTNERAAYLLAANHNLFAFLQRREYFNPPQNGLSPEARAILTTLCKYLPQLTYLFRCSRMITPCALQCETRTIAMKMTWRRRTMMTRRQMRRRGRQMQRRKMSGTTTFGKLSAVGQPNQGIASTSNLWICRC